MVGLALHSAAGYLAILDDTDPTLLVYALQELNKVVDQFWPEISDDIVKM